MKPLIGRCFVRAIFLCGLILSLPGCYYMQAARGQLEVMRKREPISEVINAEETPADLAERLRLAEQARQFSIDELALPDNDSYRTFADLERDYVVWSVVAAPEFSLDPKRWCFPVVGCVSYRGYFAEAAAVRQGQKLEANGYDVLVGGVAAYSTLGRFSDPILNTMMHWEDVDLVAVMFHELAHQVVYVKDDSGFNESFATAVEEIGIERWLISRGQEAEISAYYERRNLRQRLMTLVNAARVDLEAIYVAPINDDEKRHRKSQRLEQLGRDATSVFASAGRDAPVWWSGELNNARLVSMSLYHGYLPAFRSLLGACDNNLDCFYNRAEELSSLNQGARIARLEQLGRASD